MHGHGLIQERNINTGETVEFEVSGDKIEAIYGKANMVDLCSATQKHNTHNAGFAHRVDCTASVPST